MPGDYGQKESKGSKAGKGGASSRSGGAGAGDISMRDLKAEDNASTKAQYSGHSDRGGSSNVSMQSGKGGGKKSGGSNGGKR